MTHRTHPLIPLAQWERGGSHFKYRNHDIFWHEGGDSAAPETLLLIHGFPTASWDWSAVWPMLAQRFRLITLDLIGFGFSAKPRDYDYSIADQASLCEALLTHAGVARYHILAHDYGDTVAQELLARGHNGGLRPRLESLCFLNGGLFPETHRPRLIQRLLSSPLGSWVAQMTTKEKIAANLLAIAGPEYPPDANEIDGAWKLITHNDGLAVFPKLIGYMRERRRHRGRWVGALVSAAVPLRLVDGAADPISGAHMAKRYCELAPNSDCILLAGIGHYPQIEAPRLIADALLNFHDTCVAQRSNTAASVA